MFDFPPGVKMAGQSRCDVIRLLQAAAALLTILAAVVVICLSVQHSRDLRDVTDDVARLRRHVMSEQASARLHGDAGDTATPADNQTDSLTDRWTESLQQLMTSVTRGLTDISGKQDNLTLMSDRQRGQLNNVVRLVRGLSGELSDMQTVLIDKHRDLSENVSAAVRVSSQDKSSRRAGSKDAYTIKTHINTRLSRLTAQLSDRFDVTSGLINDTREFMGKVNTHRTEQLDSLTAYFQNVIDTMTSYIIEELQIKISDLEGALESVVKQTCQKKKRKSLSVSAN